MNYLKIIEWAENLGDNLYPFSTSFINNLI
nr:MAG TPA: hypothetical protein [Caudoviricetes sp.]